MPTDGYPKRTEQNVIDSNGKVIFTHGKLSGSSDLTRKSAMAPHGHESTLLRGCGACFTAWINENGIEVLNVAGKRAAKDERIYDVTYGVIDKLLK